VEEEPSYWIEVMVGNHSVWRVGSVGLRQVSSGCGGIVAVVVEGMRIKASCGVWIGVLVCVNSFPVEKDFVMSISGANLPIATRVSSASWSF